MQVDISVIIPVFNLEKYIGATLESVITQQGVRLEVLVVDDHSTDDTRQVVEAYAAQYSFIKLLTNERTKGVSGARNTALQHMTGKTCFLLDGDDFLPSDALAPLFFYLQKHTVPLVRGLASVFCHQRWLYIEKTTPMAYDGNTYPTGNIWLFLYDANFIKSNEIYFPEDCSIGEDHAFFCQLFCLLDPKIGIPIINHYVYIYSINHKKLLPSVRSALSFIQYLQHMRSYLENSQKAHFFSSCMQSQFSEHWLHYAYYAMQESVQSVYTYLKGCASLFSGRKDVFYPLLQPILQESVDIFWQASEGEDIKKMFSILQEKHLLQVFSSPYVGIDGGRVKSKYWKFTRVAYRVKNSASSISNAKLVWYIYTLQQKTKKILK